MDIIVLSGVKNVGAIIGKLYSLFVNLLKIVFFLSFNLNLIYYFAKFL